MRRIDSSERPAHPHSFSSTLKLQHVRTNIINWSIAIAISIVDCIWVSSSEFTISNTSITRGMTELLLLTLITLMLYATVFIPRYADVVVRLHVREVCSIVHAIVLFVFFTYGSLILQYLCVSLNWPLVDKELIAFDTALGFSWKDLFAWQTQQHAFTAILTTVYRSYAPQVLLTTLVLGFAGRTEDLADFILLFFVTVVFTILISTPLPASDTMFSFGIIDPHDASPWSYFQALRDGSMTTLSLDDKQGLISMPSLHAAHAIVLAYAVRHIRWLFPVSIVWNAAMIYSAIPFGGHYLIDVIAGVALSAAAILYIRHLKHGSADKATITHVMSHAQ
jgi:membrane-associated phospholipid phosphatase